MSPVELVRLPALVDRSRGRPGITVALNDGAVVSEQPDLARSTIREIPGKLKGTCSLAGRVAITRYPPAALLSIHAGPRQPEIVDPK
jgi:hypothetical protein